MKALMIGVLVGALAACDRPASTAVQPVASPSSAALTDVQRQILALPPAQLKGVLFRTTSQLRDVLDPDTDFSARQSRLKRAFADGTFHAA